MTIKPNANDEPIPLRRYLFGVAVNGVVFDPGTAEVWMPGSKIESRPGPGTRMAPGADRSRVWNYDGMAPSRPTCLPGRARREFVGFSPDTEQVGGSLMLRRSLFTLIGFRDARAVKPMATSSAHQ
jgi:hypothetical protein